MQVDADGVLRPSLVSLWQRGGDILTRDLAAPCSDLQSLDSRHEI